MRELWSESFGLSTLYKRRVSVFVLRSGLQIALVLQVWVLFLRLSLSCLALLCFSGIVSRDCRYRPHVSISTRMEEVFSPSAQSACYLISLTITIGSTSWIQSQETRASEGISSMQFYPEIFPRPLCP